MTRVIILGAGGHAQVVADAMLRGHENGLPFKPTGFLDDDARVHGTSILGIPVLGRIAQLGRFEREAAFVAIGDNRIRASLFHRLSETDRMVVNVIHPKSVLSPDVSLGSGILVCAGVVVNTGTSLGNNSIVNTGATVDHHCIIGEHCHVAPGVHLGGGVQIGEGAFLGIGSVVIPGCRVGRWSIIGAGSVVTRDIPDYVTAVGAPARIIRTREPDLHGQ